MLAAGLELARQTIFSTIAHTEVLRLDRLPAVGMVKIVQQQRSGRLQYKLFSVPTVRHWQPNTSPLCQAAVYQPESLAKCRSFCCRLLAQESVAAEGERESKIYIAPYFAADTFSRPPSMSHTSIYAFTSVDLQIDFVELIFAARKYPTGSPATDASCRPAKCFQILNQCLMNIDIQNI